MAVLDTIKSIMEENLSMDTSELALDTRIDSLNVDSLDMVELICVLEDKEDVDFGDPEGLETIGDIVSYVEGLKG